MHEYCQCEACRDGVLHDACCAVHNEPADPNGPCNCGATQGSTVVARLSVVDVLDLCQRELAFIGGCTLTDMPDVPLSPETSWTMDFTRLFEAIDDAIDLLVGADRRTGPECADGHTSPPMRQISGRSKYVPAHLDSRMAEGDRS